MLRGKLQAAHPVYYQVFLLHQVAGTAVGGLHETFGADAAVTNVNDPADVAGHTGVVGHNHHGNAEGLVHPLEQVEYLVGHLSVQLAGGLVGQQQGRAVCQGHADGNALLFAAG